MKKFISIFATVLAFGATAFAQTVNFDKTIYGPNDDGVYTLNLEAYVTGSITVSEETAPADIILVLDRSGSMAYSVGGSTQNVAAQDQRINILKTAVRDFVEDIKTSNATIKTEDRDTYGGHRIAFVWFSGSVVTDNNIPYNRFLNVENLTTTAASGTGRNYNRATVITRNNGANRDLLSPNANGGTYTNYAMDQAKTIINDTDYSQAPNRSRIVVFFTDGQPGSGRHGDDWPNWSDDLNVANQCINYANDIKTSTTKPATIYSVGMFNKTATTADATTTYLSYTSSDKTGVTQMPSSTDYVAVSGKYSIVVSSASALKNVFASIAHSSGGDYSASSSSSVLVDIVTSSFNIPAGTDLGTVKVYRVACTKASADAITSFDTNRANWEDITNLVDLETDRTTGEVSVTNYDYGAEWCGWNAETSSAHGHKLVLEIPIMANEDAVGGPDVATNASGSKLIIKDKDGKVISEDEFVSPVISLPVNIHIMKKGLGQGESAKFRIERTTNWNDWDYVTSVFVTNGESSNFEVDPADGQSYPVTYVRGLPSAKKVEVDGETESVGYYYKIIEEDWSWNYSFDKATGIGRITEENPTGAVTVTDKDAVTSDLFINNPIIFSNNSDNSTVRHAESKATNIFSGSGTVIYDDSKPRTSGTSQSSK